MKFIAWLAAQAAVLAGIYFYADGQVDKAIYWMVVAGFTLLGLQLEGVVKAIREEARR